VGILSVWAGGHLTTAPPIELGIAQPQLITPEFTSRALLELVVPLVITVIGVHNPQGFAVLTQASYDPPVNAMTIGSGAGSIVAAFVGAGPACVAGPSNAFLCSAGRAEGRYVGGIVYGALMLMFGLLAPVVAGLSLALPTAFIGVLGGLALMRPLQGWLTTAFGGQLGFGALVAFMVALSNVTIFNIAAPFWALVAGVATSILLERSSIPWFLQSGHARTGGK
jgi:benzoate membrane transport protein